MRIRAAAVAIVASVLVVGAGVMVMARRGASSTPAPGAGQTGAAEVERTARAFFAAINELRWRDAGTLLDPEQAAGVRREALNQVLNDAEERHLGRRAPERRWPIPAAEAVSLLQPYGGDRLRGHERPLTVAQVAAAPPGELLARFLSYRPSSVDEIPLSRLRFAFLGAAVENDTLAHVAYRVLDPGANYYRPPPVELMAAHRRGGRWVLHPADYAVAGWSDFMEPDTPRVGDAARRAGLPAAAPAPREVPPPAPVSAAWARAADGVARAFFTALRERRYEDAARQISPDELERERGLQLSAVVDELEDFGRNAGHPPVPPYEPFSPEVLEPLLRKHARAPVYPWPRVGTVAQLAALTPAQLVGRQLEVYVTLRSPDVHPPIASRYLYIGAVVESDSVAYALYRIASPAVDTIGKEPPSSDLPYEYDPGWVTLFELRPAGGQWYLKLDPEFRVSGPYTRPILHFHQD